MRNSHTAGGLDVAHEEKLFCELYRSASGDATLERTAFRRCGKSRLCFSLRSSDSGLLFFATARIPDLHSLPLLTLQERVSDGMASVGLKP
jgi:hypothetical protein